MILFATSTTSQGAPLNAHLILPSNLNITYAFPYFSCIFLWIAWKNFHQHFSVTLSHASGVYFWVACREIPVCCGGYVASSILHTDNIKIQSFLCVIFCHTSIELSLAWRVSTNVFLLDFAEGMLDTVITTGRVTWLKTSDHKLRRSSLSTRAGHLGMRWLLF